MPGDNRLAVGVEKFMFMKNSWLKSLCLKGPGFKLGVEISCNNIIKYMIKK